jgi:hypothetical protein
MRRLLRWAYGLFGLAVTVPLVILNLRLYHAEFAGYANGGLGSDAVPQLHAIRAALDRGAGSEMQGLFPEGYFFTHALYGLSWVNVGLADSSLRAEALREARWAWSRLDSSAGRAPFSQTLDPPYGVFYVGWRSWLLGGILKLQPPDERSPLEVETLQADCDALAAALDTHPHPYLAAYPGQAWPVDSVVAMAALRLHDDLFPVRYTATLDRWLAALPHDGLLPHQVNARTGESLDDPRGTSQSLIPRFLYDIDPDTGVRHYRQFRQTLVRPFLGVPGVREFADGGGLGDVDSGPLLFGFSASATVNLIGEARVLGDDDVANALISASEAVGLPWEWAREKSYVLGVLPVGEAFLVWGKTSRPWVAERPSVEYPSAVSGLWRWPFHGATGLLVLILWAPRLWRKAR